MPDDIDSASDEDIIDTLDGYLEYWLSFVERFPEIEYFHCDSPFHLRIFGWDVVGLAGRAVSNKIPKYSIDYSDRTENWCWDCMQHLQRKQKTNHRTIIKGTDHAKIEECESEEREIET